MIRIDRSALDEAVRALIACAASAQTVSGGRILFRLDAKQAEACVLGALSIVAPNGGPATASDVYFVDGFGSSGREISFPPQPQRAKL